MRRLATCSAEIDIRLFSCEVNICAPRGPFLEVILQCKLDKSRVASALRKSELRSPELQGLRLFANLADGLEHRIHVVPDIEKFGAEFDAHLFTYGEKLEDG